MMNLGAGMGRRVFSDDFRFCLQHQECHIRVWRHRGECILAACIRHRHISPSPGMMVCGAIGYTSHSPLVCIDGTLDGTCYISGVLGPVALPFIRALQNPTFQQDNGTPHVAGSVRTSLDTKMSSCFPGLHIHQTSRQ
ncbi:transposable element Tcb1 transposase [Trichonephila clavipes]|uniref:Transposable element Tcb1 transposase n=1 Tax=Trichonephila clavipes TaxID=2585209 RepID=A0A8X7BAL1_TRICX|nr:transposable element Tcb1 transposase [Trichonephila clavipes]